MAYDAPDYLIRREIHVPNLTGAASASLKKFHMFQAAKLKAVHGTIITAGTNAAAAFDIYAGTTSVGSLAIGTNTAGSLVTSGAINAAIPQNGFIEIKGAANSATAVASLAIEYEVDPSATETA